jgi:diguanylate cyclase (GGDEF)-like protein
MRQTSPIHNDDVDVNSPERQYARMRNLALGAATVLTLMAIASLVSFQLYSERALREGILSQARAHASQFNAVRTYVQGFSGVYVPASEDTIVNPHLEGITNIVPMMTREDGKRFVLQNAPIVAREISAILEESSKGEPVRMNLYGANPLNPLNTPDAFAHEAIAHFKSGKREYYAFGEEDGADVFRYALPVPLEAKCSACHIDLVGQTHGVGGASVIEIDVTRPLRFTAQSRSWTGLAILAVVATTMSLVYLYTTRVLARVREAQSQLYEMARKDALTGLFTRRVGLERLEEEVARAQRERKPLACCVMDIDDFKRVNDDLGHHVGDRALMAVGGTMLAHVRPYDVTARVGGEEFLVVMPDSNCVTAQNVIERLREQIAEATSATPELDRGLTCSAGIAVLDLKAPESAESLYIRADNALLAAKRGGKDRSHRDRGECPAAPSTSAVVAPPTHAV